MMQMHLYLALRWKHLIIGNPKAACHGRIRKILLQKAIKPACLPSSAAVPLSVSVQTLGLVLGLRRCRLRALKVPSLMTAPSCLGGDDIELSPQTLAGAGWTSNSRTESS